MAVFIYARFLLRDLLYTVVVVTSDRRVGVIFLVWSVRDSSQCVHRMGHSFSRYPHGTYAAARRIRDLPDCVAELLKSRPNPPIAEKERRCRLLREMDRNVGAPSNSLTPEQKPDTVDNAHILKVIG